MEVSICDLLCFLCFPLLACFCYQCFTMNLMWLFCFLWYLPPFSQYLPLYVHLYKMIIRIILRSARCKFCMTNKYSCSLFFLLCFASGPLKYEAPAKVQPGETVLLHASLFVCPALFMHAYYSLPSRTAAMYIDYDYWLLMLNSGKIYFFREILLNEPVCGPSAVVWGWRSLGRLYFWDSAVPSGYLSPDFLPSVHRPNQQLEMQNEI